jgi:hypothetical protein
MSQMPSNAPVLDSKPGPAGWLPVWIKAVSQPNEQTFISLTETPEATSKTAFIWVFIAGTISGIAQAIFQAISTALGVTPQMPIPGLEQFTPPPTTGDGTTAIVSLVTGLCLSPVAGLISIIFFAIGTAVTQWIAKLFGGTGTFEKLAYASAAISVPVTLVSSVLIVFGAIPYVNICTGILSFGIGIYALVLQIMAVKGVNRFGWGPAIGSVLIPGVVIFAVCACVVFGGLMLMGPVLNDTFNQINQSLAP